MYMHSVKRLHVGLQYVHKLRYWRLSH